MINFCTEKKLRLAIAFLVTHQTNASLEERKEQIKKSPLRRFFDFVAVTDGDKDLIF